VLLVPAKKEIGAWPWESRAEDTVRSVGESVVDTLSSAVESVPSSIAGIRAAVSSAAADPMGAVKAVAESVVVAAANMPTPPSML
jgi:hypothetical protein